MKKLISLTLFVILNYAVQAQIPSAGIVAHWPFTGNASDASPNANNGNTSKVTLTKGKQGASNTAYKFDSADSYISIPYDTSMNVTNISICTVIKPSAFYTNTCQGNYIISRGIQGNAGHYFSGYFDNAYNDCSVTDTNAFVFCGQAGTYIKPSNTMQSTTRVHTNNWYCFIMIFDGVTGKYYVNGSLVHSFTGWNAMGSSTDSICIGKYPWGGSSFPYNFIGVLDDIAIYNRVLSDSEINNYCTNAPMIGVEDTTTSIAESNVINYANLQVYPNPNDGVFKVSGKTASANITIQVYNTVGVLVYNTSVITDNKQINTIVDIKSLPSGLYTLKLSDEKNVYTARLLKQ